MPKSIIDIDVNDESFQRYLGTFEKYRESLKSMPGLWADSTEGATELAGVVAAMTATMLAQLDASSKLAKAEKDATEARRKEAKDAKERDKEAAERRRKAIEDAKEFSRTVADTALSLGKWAIGGGAAGLAAGALSLWGFDKFIGGVGAERRLSQGFGVSTGERQALGVTMQRYFDVNSVLGNIAQAQVDPSQQWVFKGMGVNTQGKDPAQIATEASIAARRVFMEGNQNWLWAQAHGLDKIFSFEELKRLAATPERDLRASISGPGGYNELKNAGLTDEVNKKWQNLIVTLDAAGLKLKNALIDKLTKLEPDLEVLIQKFTQLALTVLDRIDFTLLGDGLDKFTKYISDGKFQDDFKLFIDNVGLISQKIVEWVHYLSDPPSEADPANPGKRRPSKDNNLWDYYRHGMDDLYNLGLVKDDNQYGGGAYGFGRSPSNKTSGLFPSATGAQHPLGMISGVYGLVPGLLSAIYDAESASGRRAGRSAAGALGPFQFMPATAQRFGVTDRMNFGQEADAAGKYFHQLMKEFHGNVAEAVAAYNWGEGHVERDIRKHGTDWLRFAPKETRGYVGKVMHSINVFNHTGNNVAVSADAASR